MSSIRVFNPWSMVPSVWDDATDLMSGQFVSVPKVNMYEKDDTVHVEMEVPGFSIDSLHISVTGDTLKVTGKTQDKTEEKKDRKYFITEMSERSFTRMITLPYEVVAEKAKAEFKDGILNLTLPKSEKALPKTVTIEAK